MGRRRKGRPVHGWLALDKPVGMTSTQALGKLRWLFGAAKAGHGGTLDPLASGLLPIAFGEATKTVSYMMDGIKKYAFTIEWGRTTNTDDAEGEVIAQSDMRPARNRIEAALGRFCGHILQTPPQFSAIKVAGERAYDIARSGEAVALEPREIYIEDLVITDIPDADHCTLEATCGKGAYVRAIARDLAQVLGTCGHVSALRRTRVGPFFEKDMISLAQLEEMRHIGAKFEELDRCLKSVATALDDIPALAVNTTGAALLKRGQPLLLRGNEVFPEESMIYATLHDTPICIGQVREGCLHPVRVFNLPI
jgi:tRNA pseudouridine55 synthase